jgi:hypothetical protein
VPLSIPVLEFNDMPGGSDPSLIDQTLLAVVPPALKL